MSISRFTIWSILLSFFLTIIIAKISIPYLRKFKLGQNIRDDGPQSHLSKAGTPTMGGIFFVIAIILTTFCLGNFSREVFAVLIGMLGFTLIGFLDDFFKLVMKRSLGLTEIQKLIIQFIISIIVIIFIEKVVGTDLRYQLIPFVKGTVNFGWLIYPILVFVMIGTANATNLTCLYFSRIADFDSGSVYSCGRLNRSGCGFDVFTPGSNDSFVTQTGEFGYLPRDRPVGHIPADDSVVSAGGKEKLRDRKSVV